MLNKSQSKRRNAWKYFLIVPLLAAFLLYFQVKVVAQERRLVTESDVFDHKTEIVVDKNTSDAQLKADAQRLKKERGVKLKFSKVKRNAQGEITSIKAEYKTPDGKKGTTQFSGQDPIRPLGFYIHSNGQAGFSQPRSLPRLVKIQGHGLGKGEGHDELKFDFDGEDVIGMEIPEIDIEIPEIPMPGIPEWKTNGMKSKVYIQKDGEKPIMIVDGERVDVDVDAIDMDGKTFSYSFSTDGDGEGVMIVDGKKIHAEAMEKAKAAIEKAGVKRAEVRKKVEQAMEKRKEAAVARGHFFGESMSKAERDAIKAEMEAARAELEKARAELEKERKALEKARSEKK